MPTVATLDDFSRIVAAIYSAVMTPDNWTTALTDLQQMVDGQCALIRVDETGRSIQAASLIPAARDDYHRHYHRIDYVLEAVERGPVGVLRSGRSLVALQSQSEFHIDWVRPLEMTDGLFVRLTDGPAPLLFLAAGPRPPKPFIPLVSALVPHLQQALRSQAHINDLRRHTDDLGTLTQTLRHGIIVVTTDSHVVYANAAAEDMLRSADGLRTRTGRLEAVVAGADSALQHSIDVALAADHPHRSGSSLLCRRRPELRPYVIEVVPIDPATDVGSPRRAMVVVVDPEGESATPAELLRSLYGLTASETDIALMVLHGGGVKAIAEGLSVSQATVKTHLQHVFDKTGTHRQADLVGLLLGLGSPFR